MSEIEQKNVAEPVKLEEKKSVVVSVDLQAQFDKAVEEFNQLAQQLRAHDDRVKQTADTFQNERNKIQTRLVEIQGLVRYLRSELEKAKAQDKVEEKK